MNTIVLKPAGRFQSHRGYLPHDDVIGLPEGSIITNTEGTQYLAFRPLLADYVLSMPRGATVVYPKDAGQIIAMADIFPGATVVEAGVGSGALSLSLLRAVGGPSPDTPGAGRLISIERRPDFARIAKANVAAFMGGKPANWQLEIGDFADVVGQVCPPESVDRVVLDLLAPWENVAAAWTALRPGGVFCAYVATTTQLSRLAEALRAENRWNEPVGFETFVRTWHLEGLAVRPDHRMIGHTGFLLITRRLADGVAPLLRRRRPVSAASGGSYLGADADQHGDWSEDDLGYRPVSDRKIRQALKEVAKSTDDYEPHASLKPRSQKNKAFITTDR